MGLRSAVIVAMLGAAIGCGPTAAPKFAITHVEKRATLDNGLRLVVVPDTTTPMVEVHVRYEVGAKEDPAGKAGLAHLVEHMMFQHRFGAPETPIERRPPTFMVLPTITTEFNAFTNWDTTHYYLVAPKEKLDILLRIEAARMATGCETIPPAEFEREREVVRNEIRQRGGSADGQRDQAMLDLVYPRGHAYNQSVGGNDQQLASITLPDVCKFMADYYRPGRATVIVTGNVDTEAAGKMVNFNFGAIAKGNPAPLKPVAPVALHKAKKEIQLDIDRTMVHILFALPPQNSDEYRAVQLMAFVLAGRVQRFARDWKLGEVNVNFLGGAMAPTIAIGLELRPDKSVDEGLDYLWKALESTRRNTGIQLEKGSYEDEKITKIHYRQNLITGLEPLSARALEIAELVQFDKKIKFDSNQVFLYELLDRVDQLDYSKYQSFVKKTLDRDHAVVLISRANKQGIRGDRRASLKFSAKTHDQRPPPPVDLSEAKRSLLVPEGASVLAKAERFELGNGMHVVLLPYEGLPIVHAELVFGVGSAHEPAGEAGLADVAASFLQMPMEANAYGRAGVQLARGAGWDTTVFTGRGINIYLDVILKGLERLVKTGSIDQEQIEEYQRSYKETFHRDDYQRRYSFQRELEVALYGEAHPYVSNGTPTPKTLARIGRDAALGFAHKHFSAKNATLVVTGSFDAAQARKHIQDVFGGWDGGHRDAPVIVAATARKTPEYIGVIGRDADPQMQVAIAYPSAIGIDGQHAARLVIAQMLDLRMASVREQLGSTYGAGAFRDTRRGPTAYIMTGAIDAQRAGESLAFMRDQVERLRKGEEFDRDFVLARRAVYTQLLAVSTESYTLARRLREIVAFDLSPDYHDKLLRHVAAVSPAQVKALIDEELQPSREVIVALGARGVLDKAFAKAGVAKPRWIEPGKEK